MLKNNKMIKKVADTGKKKGQIKIRKGKRYGLEDLLNNIKKHYKYGTLLKTASNKISNNLVLISYYSRDIKNKIKYGKAAPVFAERIWINPLDCHKGLDGKYILSGIYQRKNSGLVVESAWPLAQAIPIKDVSKINFCIDHWINGTSWEDTGIYEHIQKYIDVKGEHDRCRNIDDIVKRYNNLDLIFNRIKKEGRFKTREELNPTNFREEGGVLVHIGPDGELFFSFNGCHRFAIAIVLEMIMPAQIGYVHKSAIPFLSELRRKSKEAK